MPHEQFRDDAQLQTASGNLPQPGREQPKNMAKRSLIVGICGFATGLVPFLGIALGIAAVVLGVIAMTRKQKQWMWATGVSLGALGALSSLVVTLALAFGSPPSVVSSTSAESSGVVIPKVIGMEVSKASTKLEELGLAVVFVDAASGEAIDAPLASLKVEISDPEAGTSVEEASTVTLTVSAGKEEKPEAAAPEVTEEPGPVAPATDIEVLDLSYEGNKFISATFPVADAFTKAGVIRNLQKGCVEAIQAAKGATPTWYEFDTIQCMGMFDGSALVGSANFSGALLSEISDVEMQDDPEHFWELADRSNLAPAYR